MTNITNFYNNKNKISRLVSQVLVSRGQYLDIDSPWGNKSALPGLVSGFILADKMPRTTFYAKTEPKNQ